MVEITKRLLPTIGERRFGSLQGTCVMCVYWAGVDANWFDIHVKGESAGDDRPLGDMEAAYEYDSPHGEVDGGVSWWKEWNANKDHHYHRPTKDELHEKEKVWRDGMVRHDPTTLARINAQKTKKQRQVHAALGKAMPPQGRIKRQNKFAESQHFPGFVAAIIGMSGAIAVYANWLETVMSRGRGTFVLYPNAFLAMKKT